MAAGLAAYLAVEQLVAGEPPMEGEGGQGPAKSHSEGRIVLVVGIRRGSGSGSWRRGLG